MWFILVRWNSSVSAGMRMPPFFSAWRRYLSDSSSKVGEMKTHSRQ